MANGTSRNSRFHEGPPEVTVVCVTYNHARYIGEALDSFLSQQTDFPIQVFVADDCSTDGTREIVERYARENPRTVRAFLPGENRGAERNLIEMCSQAGTEFVAICDGDDYWTDPLKLQKQRDYMRANPGMRACFHDTQVVLEGGAWFLAADYANTPDGSLRWCTGHKSFRRQESYTVADYVPCGFVHSSSMFIRWDGAIEVPEWFYGHILGDYTLWCLQVGLGTFGYIDEAMSVYRRHVSANYNYATREEFWGATKPDWIRIDADLRAYFEDLGAPEELLAVFDARQRDDLGKLLKYAYRSGDKLFRNRIVVSYAQSIEAHGGIGVELDASGSPTKRCIQEIDKCFECSIPLLSLRGLKRRIASVLR